MITIKTKKTYEINKLLKKKIFILKNDYWNYSLKNQNIWFKKNVFKNDLHNLVFFKKQLIGYTLLKTRSQNNKNKKYIYLDTFIISKKFRKFGLGKMLINFNNFYIIKKKLIGVLLCYERTIKFYKNFGWKKISNQKIKFIDKKVSDDLKCMIYSNSIQSKNLNLYVNK